LLGSCARRALLPQGPSRLSNSQPQTNELLVLPELSDLPTGLEGAELRRRAEPRGGAFEQRLAQRARAGGGYLVGSYPEGEGGQVLYSVALAGPAGTILGRYSATHFTASKRAWASCGW
jgi:predicted amidohydrolase